MRNHPPLTERQRQVLDFVILELSERGFPPTVREVATKFNVGSTASNDVLRALVRKGYLLHSPKRARGLSLPRPHVNEVTRLRALAIEALVALNEGNATRHRALLEQIAGHPHR